MITQEEKEKAIKALEKELMQALQTKLKKHLDEIEHNSKMMGRIEVVLCGIVVWFSYWIYHLPR